jgi:hypothetical protein
LALGITLVNGENVSRVNLEFDLIGLNVCVQIWLEQEQGQAEVGVTQLQEAAVVEAVVVVVVEAVGVEVVVKPKQITLLIWPQL